MFFKDKSETKLSKTNPYNDADGRDAGCGHDLGAVGDEVEKDGDDGFGPVVELVPQHRGEVAAGASQSTVTMEECHPPIQEILLLLVGKEMNESRLTPR